MRTRIAADPDVDGSIRTLTAAWAHVRCRARPSPARRGSRSGGSSHHERSALPLRLDRGRYAAVAVWIPPDGTELTADQEAQVEPLLANLAGARAGEIMEVVSALRGQPPRGRSHAYLGLLGTRPEDRGRGLGMGLLAETLEASDAEGTPAYWSRPTRTTTHATRGFDSDRWAISATQDRARAPSRRCRGSRRLRLRRAAPVPEKITMIKADSLHSPCARTG